MSLTIAIVMSGANWQLSSCKNSNKNSISNCAINMHMQLSNSCTKIIKICKVILSLSLGLKIRPSQITRQTKFGVPIDKDDQWFRMISGGSRISHRGGVHPLGGGHRPPTWALFGENVCENERIGSHMGGVRRARPP